jgi:hypothetical protein
MRFAVKPSQYFLEDNFSIRLRFSVFTTDFDTIVYRLLLEMCARSGTPLTEISTMTGPPAGLIMRLWPSKMESVADSSKTPLPPVLFPGLPAARCPFLTRSSSFSADLRRTKNGKDFLALLPPG